VCRDGVAPRDALRQVEVIAAELGERADQRAGLAGRNRTEPLGSAPICRGEPQRRLAA